MKSNHTYLPLRDLDDPQDERNPPRARHKGLWIILAVAIAVGLALAAPFYGGPAHGVFSGAITPLKAKDIHKALEKADIIPNIIDDFTPAFAMSVKWSDDPVRKASLGNTLKPKDLQDVPEIYLTQPPSLLSADSEILQASRLLPMNNMVLVLTDPDAPSHEDNKWSEFCHWIAVGVPFVNVSSLTFPESQGAKVADPLEPLVEYKPPGPPPKTGKHRYIFIALAPKNATSDPLDLVAPSERRNWGTGVAGAGVKGWAEDMGLAPVAANFIYAKNKEQ